MKTFIKITHNTFQVILEKIIHSNNNQNNLLLLDKKSFSTIHSLYRTTIRKK